MPQITAADLRRIAPHGSTAKRRRQAGFVPAIADALPAVFDEFDITTPIRQAHFLAQVAHESDGFAAMEEYASGAAYEGRRDLGNVNPGDGKRYKGRGPFMLTGLFNYRKFGRKLGLDLVDDPDVAGDEDDPARAADPAVGMRVAGLYWQDRGLNALADRDDLRGITRRINGGYNGLRDRERYLGRAKAVLGLADDAAPALLAIGSAGADVVTLQERLEAALYHPGAIDGRFGRMTDTQVRAFQRDAGLAIDGKVRVGGPTWSALEEAVELAVEAPRAPERRTAGMVELAAEGSRIAGASVKGLGAALAALGAGGGTILAQAAGIFEEHAPALEVVMAPLGGTTNIALGALVLFSLYSAWQHYRAGAARAEDHRTGKTA